MSTNGRTALHYAARNGHLETVRYFLSLGADFQREDHDGLGAFEHAAADGHMDTVRYLLGRGADVNQAGQ